MSNIIDVARSAGVSPMTVSRTLNSPELVSPDTRARVMEAVRQLNYVPNAAARSLVQGKTRTLALILSDIRNPHFTTISRGVEDVAQEHGYTLMLANTDESPAKERAYLRVLMSQRVDGVLISPSGDGDLSLLQRRKIPFVLLDRTITGSSADLVTQDSHAGGRALMAHLLERGYRQITFVGGPAGVSSLEERLAGYQEAMREAGLEPQVRLGRYDQASGEEIVEAMVAEGAVPEAIVAANNFVALGVIVALRRHGLRVPEEVGLACFGDIPTAALMDPFLTVVALPAYAMGRLAMEVLLERIQGAVPPPRRRVLPVELVIRRSTPGPRRG
jgi:LacI family transcriptional regulator